ncbi:SDR family NAD(P)-dependent oxidoreductase [Leekyejoonella antrihumi]|nr:SDR family oxidoreductase [Leekyejoonella antrihumi]
MFDLTGKSISIFGAAGGIGRACTHALVECGGSVVAVDWDKQGLDTLAEELGGRCATASVDVLDAAAVDHYLDAAGRIDVLVYTPAMNVRKRLSDFTEEEFRRVIELNLVSAFRVLRGTAMLMAKQGAGSIVAFSSIRATTVEPGQGAYAASKAGLEMLIRTLASELGPQNVRANAIRPGVVETRLTEQLRANAEWNRAYSEKSALGRWARPSELAGAVVYLASDASSFVTGSILTVDGGWTAQDGRYTPPA